MNQHSLTRKLSAIAASVIACASVAQASTLYTEDFSSYSVGDTPANWSVNANWAIAEKAGAKVYAGTDAAASNYFYSRLNFTSITYSTGQPLVEFSFDLNVENYRNLTAGSTGTFRITLQPDSSSTERYTLGIGYANLGTGNTLFFYADDGSAPVPSTSNAIGYTVEDGFASGFNLGPIGNDPSRGTGGNTYRMTLAVDQVTGNVTITATNLSAPEQVATYHDVWTPVELSSTGSLLFTTGTASMGRMEIGRVEIRAIPEPSTAILMGAALVVGSVGIYGSKAR